MGEDLTLPVGFGSTPSRQGRASTGSSRSVIVGSPVPGWMRWRMRVASRQEQSEGDWSGYGHSNRLEASRSAPS
ncbi:hypothetical protein B0675_36495 [Streptomyces sp. M41(2017)]|nr:hypothetical protein B0675_36495 [Streptomyces sp. M41(2017)]